MVNSGADQVAVPDRLADRRQGVWDACPSFIHRDPLQAVIRHDDAAQDFLGIANVL